MLPRVAITVGDPAGIGPEIAEKAARDPRVLEVVRAGHLRGRSRPAPIRSARYRRQAGPAAYDTIVRAVEAARAGEVDAIATAPVNKLAFARAGLPWKGHTDLLGAPVRDAARRDAVPFAIADRRRWRPCTSRCRRSPRLLTTRAPDRDHRADRRVAAAASASAGRGSPSPALNPHAGEDGLLGHRRRRRDRAGGRRDARTRGIDVSGPWPADTVFVRATRGEFDAVVACYHDQGLIPVKLLAFGEAVNVTIGLPIIRTSVDHGTAFDIAGQGVADAGSMVQAVLLAARAGRGEAPGAERRERRDADDAQDRRANRSSPTTARRSSTTTSSRPSRPASRCSAPR